MTFDEAKRKLQDLKNAKRRVLNIHERFEELVKIKSSLDIPAGRSKGKFSSPVEQAYERIEERKLALAEALNHAFSIEDELTAAIESLDSTERDVIIGSYLRQRTHDQLAEELGYSERNIRYIKETAIEKLSEKL